MSVPCPFLFFSVYVYSFFISPPPRLLNPHPPLSAPPVFLPCFPFFFTSTSPFLAFSPPHPPPIYCAVPFRLPCYMRPFFFSLVPILGPCFPPQFSFSPVWFIFTLLFPFFWLVLRQQLTPLLVLHRVNFVISLYLHSATTPPFLVLFQVPFRRIHIPLLFRPSMLDLFVSPLVFDTCFL